MEIRTPMCQSMYTKLFVTEIFVITKTKHNFMSIIGERMDKVWKSHSME